MIAHIQEFVELEVAPATGASLRKEIDWHSIDWKKVHHNVRRLQVRIVKALKAGNKRKVRALQFILTRSFSGRAVAVKRVTENRGRRTPGLDNVLFDTPEKKAQAISDLQHKGYQPQPLKRIFIPKGEGKLRPLGIPTSKDRAMQALHLLALDPIAETVADANSYGFRKERSAADAIEQCFCALAKKTSAQWILEGDIKGCFDHISHDWLLANIPIDKTVLRKWLKAGHVYQQHFNPTDEGTPQGGIISPVLANMTLDGLERALKEKFSPSEWIGRRNQVNVVRYADDFIITGRTKELLEQEVKPMVESFLAERGLELSETKTRITHIEEGFDFLGTNIRKYDGKFLTRPSKKSVKSVLNKIKETIRTNLHQRVGKLIGKLNPILRGWANYHRHSSSKATFGKVDNEVHRKLWQWARRRHPSKSDSWIRKKYFSIRVAQRAEFGATSYGANGKKETVRVAKAKDTPIKRHVKIRATANPYDPEWEPYFEERIKLRMMEKLAGRKKVLRLWKQQEGICPICRQEMTTETGWHIHHLRWRVEGGGEEIKNLVLLHANCHRQVHSRGKKVTKPRPVKRASEEA